MNQTIQIRCADCGRLVVMTVVGETVSATGNHEVVSIKQSKMMLHAVNCTKGNTNGGA